MTKTQGTKETKDFYNLKGWRVSDAGSTLDSDLFGVKEDGPIRKRMYERKWTRILERLDFEGNSTVLEVGCGGSPEKRLLGVFENYIGTDFSSEGLRVASQTMSEFEGRTQFVEADAVNLPFDDESFDAVYSAHMIYHIDNAKAQAASLSEMLRVLRPGGILVLSTANPRPFLFPFRMTMRIVADTPIISTVARRFRGQSPVPYKPHKLSWYRRRLRGISEFEIINGGIASTWFNRSVSEYSGFGSLVWRLFEYCDRIAPSLSGYLGNYAVILAKK